VVIKKNFTLRSVVLTEIRKFYLPKICKRLCFQLLDDNINLMEWTNLAVYIAFNAMF